MPCSYLLCCLQEISNKNVLGSAYQSGSRLIAVAKSSSPNQRAWQRQSNSRLVVLPDTDTLRTSPHLWASPPIVPQGKNLCPDQGIHQMSASGRERKIPSTGRRIRREDAGGDFDAADELLNRARQNLKDSPRG